MFLFFLYKHFFTGLAILSPLLIGSHLGAILAMSFGATRKNITIWMTASLVLWAIVMGIASHYGMEYFAKQTGRHGFLEHFINVE